MTALALAMALTACPAARGATIGLPGGPHAEVAEAARGPLQCVLDGLAARGYPVRFMRGYGRGSVRASLHPAGMAMDVNQLRRNVTAPRMPGGEVELAASCGAVSGAAWGHGDSGHFQVGGWAGGGRHAGRHRRHHR